METIAVFVYAGASQALELKRHGSRPVAVLE